MLCSTLSLPWTFRSRMGSLKSLPVLEIDAECPVLVAQGDHGPFAAQIPLHPHDLLIGNRQIRDVGEGHRGGNVLFERQVRLRNRGDVGKLRIDLGCG